MMRPRGSYGEARRRPGSVAGGASADPEATADEAREADEVFGSRGRRPPPPGLDRRDIRPSGGGDPPRAAPSRPSALRGGARAGARGHRAAERGGGSSMGTSPRGGRGRRHSSRVGSRVARVAATFSADDALVRDVVAAARGVMGEVVEAHMGAIVDEMRDRFEEVAGTRGGGDGTRAATSWGPEGEDGSRTSGDVDGGGEHETSGVAGTTRGRGGRSREV